MSISKKIAKIFKQETSTGVIEMVDISHLELKKMVQFFYSMSYDDDIPEVTERETVSLSSPLQLYVRMFALGDRYDIPGLRDVAAKKCSSRCAASWEPLEFIESIRDVYEGTPPSIRYLRNPACILTRKNLPKMLDDDAVATAYEKVLIDVPEFTKDLLGIYIVAPLYGACSTCASTQAFEPLQVRCNRCGKDQGRLRNIEV